VDAIWQELVLRHTAAESVQRGDSIQSLWSGFGEIFRAHLKPAELGSVIVKHIAPGSGHAHPRGWGTDRSTQRKLNSYAVETHWYAEWSPRISGNAECRIAKYLGSAKEGDQRWIVLEDLDAAGFDQRRGRLGVEAAQVCLRWLANFHAEFIGESPEGLWPVGTYWHLATRPDEFESMQDGSLKEIAVELDELLNSCKFQTIVHGDAKVANFCFSPDNDRVAVVDFQYVGGGCGMKDVAYFLGSCFDESECEREVPSLLDDYFSELRSAVADKDLDGDALEAEWRDLFAPAWADFHRFLLGWVPSHPKIHRYTQQLTKETVDRLIG